MDRDRGGADQRNGTGWPTGTRERAPEWRSDQRLVRATAQSIVPSVDTRA